MARQSSSSQQPRSSRGGRVALTGAVAAGVAVHHRPRLHLPSVHGPKLGASGRSRGRVGRRGPAAVAVGRVAPLPRITVAAVSVRRRGASPRVAAPRRAAAPAVRVRAAAVPARVAPRRAGVSRTAVLARPSAVSSTRPRVRSPRVAARVSPPPRPVVVAGRGRRLSIAQAAAHQQRLATQHRDLSRRGHGNRAARRMVAARAAAPSSGHHKGLSRSNRVKSQSQQRLLFARHEAYAHEAAKRGAAYQALPDRVRPRGT
jgi:hypothetical protein